MDPLAPGTHTIEIHIEGTYIGQPVDSTITTTIIVQQTAREYGVAEPLVGLATPWRVAEAYG